MSPMERRLSILVIDDDDNDVEFILRAIKKAGYSNPVHVCHDGEEGVTYLSGDGKYSDRAKFPFPQVVLTDLKMSGLSGLEVIKWVRSNAAWRSVPLIVFSSSGMLRDINAAYHEGASCYVKKPSSSEDFERVIKSVLDFWLMCERPEVPGKPVEDISPVEIQKRVGKVARRGAA